MMWTFPSLRISASVLSSGYPTPLIDVDEAKSVHSAVLQFLGARGVPFLVPVDRFFPQFYDFLQTLSLRETVLLLVLRDPIPIVALASVIFECDRRRVEVKFGRDLVEHHIVRDTAVRAVPEAHEVSLVDQRPFLGVFQVRDPGGFMGLVYVQLSDGAYDVPVAGRDGSIFFGAHFALINSRVISIAVKIAFVVQQFHRMILGSPGQYCRHANECR